MMTVHLNTQGMTRGPEGYPGGSVEAGKEKNKPGNTFFAGDSNITSRTDEVRERARKQAMKIVSDAFSGEQKLDDKIQTLRDKVSALQNENKELQDQIGSNNEKVSELSQMYGIDPEGEEQKELELLHKRSQIENGVGGDQRLSAEEFKKLTEIDARGLTEYQQRAMDIYADSDHMQRTMEDNKLAIQGHNAAISAIRNERLKSDPIGEAMDTADTIRDAASDAIKGMLVQDSMEHIEDKAAEEKEKAEERAEKKEEEEEKLEAVKARDEMYEELIDRAKNDPSETELQIKRTEKKDQEIIENGAELKDLTNPAGSADAKNQVEVEITKLLNGLNLLPEDLKGAAVDDFL